MINLKIDPEFQNQIPPLTDDEYRQLEENILKEGNRCPSSCNFSDFNTPETEFVSVVHI